MSQFKVRKDLIYMACEKCIKQMNIYVREHYHDFIKEELKLIYFAKDLIKACEVDCEDHIMLSVEDAAFVNEWV